MLNITIQKNVIANTSAVDVHKNGVIRHRYHGLDAMVFTVNGLLSAKSKSLKNCKELGSNQTVDSEASIKSLCSMAIVWAVGKPLGNPAIECNTEDATIVLGARKNTHAIITAMKVMSKDPSW